MTTTTSTYLSIINNLPAMQAMTAKQPAVQTASAYYAANIAKVTSIDDFVGNYRLLSYALDAFGLGDQINSTALIKQVLEGGVANPDSLANTLPQWKAFATAFNFAANGASSISTPAAVAATRSDYVEQQLESNQGQQDVGVQLAMYFNRVAPTVTTEYRHSGRPEPARGRRDHLRSPLVVLGGKHRCSSQDPFAAPAAFRSDESQDIATAHRALHGRV